MLQHAGKKKLVSEKYSIKPLRKLLQQGGFNEVSQQGVYSQEIQLGRKKAFPISASFPQKTLSWSRTQFIINSICKWHFHPEEKHKKAEVKPKLKNKRNSERKKKKKKTQEKSPSLQAKTPTSDHIHKA